MSEESEGAGKMLEIVNICIYIFLHSLLASCSAMLCNNGIPIYFHDLFTCASLCFAQRFCYTPPCIAFMFCLPVLRTKALLHFTYGKTCIVFMFCLIIA